MQQYFKYDEWNIIEDSFSLDSNEISESIYSLGNGQMGQRANFEEAFSGPSLQGSYVAGVYYPDKTRVGWWKNGYPEYFAKVLNSTNWIGIGIKVDGEELDLAKCEVDSFNRTLNMKEGLITRSFTVTLANGNKILVETKRFVSMVRFEIGAIKYSVTPLNFSGTIEFTPYLDGGIANKDSNYDETFWNIVNKGVSNGSAYITTETKKLFFHVTTRMDYEIFRGSELLSLDSQLIQEEKLVGNTISVECDKDEQVTMYKYVANTSSRYYAKDKLVDTTKELVERAKADGYDTLLQEHIDAWASKWAESDIVIEGDVSAQQAIRFNIFQLNQTYTGEDATLNIGPKGFTGEKYGGSTYWDTEAYCIPFYLSTSQEEVSRNLLIYRHKQLGKAIENAAKLGFTDGAALYPMVTMNGEECHNEWEITFEEIHRNGAIAHAIYNYVNYTDDSSYLREYGLDVLTGITRFWAQRVNFSQAKNKYVMLGVTGPNEYENNVNNNWYTNKIACWCLDYTLKVIKSFTSDEFSKCNEKLNISEEEMKKWADIIDNMYYPVDEERNIFLQQDGFLDKDIIQVENLEESNLPLCQKWSWDRILRSCFIKQADVLQGLYFLEDDYDVDTIKRNFDFYEPITVHESSLSPCIHAILANKIGYHDKAYEMYLRTARLDLDNYNNDTEDGCHITSMAGTWMSVVEGFGGFRVKDGKVVLNPHLPTQWNSFSFKIVFRTSLFNIKVMKDSVVVTNESNTDSSIVLNGVEHLILGGETKTI